MVPPTFQNNPGKTAEFVKLNEHPYLKGKGVPSCPECRRQGLVADGTGNELCQMHKLIFRDLRDKTKQALLNWRDTLPKNKGLNITTTLPYLPILHISRSSIKSTLSKYHSKPWERNIELLNIKETLQSAAYAGWAYDEILPNGEQKHKGVSGWLYYKTNSGFINIRVDKVDGKRAYYCIEENANPAMKKGEPEFL